MEVTLTNIPRIYTAVAEIMSCWVFFVILKRKINLKKIFLLSIGAMVLELAYVMISNGMPMLFFPFHIIFIFLMMFLYMYLTLDLSRMTVFYYTMKAFLWAELMASFEWQLVYYFHWFEVFSKMILTICTLIIYFVGYIIIWFIEKKLTNEQAFREISLQETFVAVLIVGISFILSNISFFSGDTLFSGSSLFDMFNIRTIFDLMGVVALYAFQSKVAEVEMKADLMEMSRFVQTQYDKYRNYQDSIDFINMKYHDLMHQMSDLREQISPEKKSILINNIESELKEYNPFFETGNPVLDALLDSKRAICRKENITMTVVTDGKLLGFMHVSDICSIFGNALDNAIESVIMIPDKQKRLIHIEVTLQKNFLLIIFENACEQAVTITNGIPKTMKKDKLNHGLGTRSIQYTVQKYKGSAIFSMKDQWFLLRILIPLNQKLE